MRRNIILRAMFHKKKNLYLLQKNALRMYWKIGWRSPGQAGALFPATATVVAGMTAAWRQTMAVANLKKKIARASVMIISHVRSSACPLILFEFPYVFDCTHDH